MSLAIHHNTEKSRFEYEYQGLLSFVDYHLHDEVMTIVHTYVPKALNGQGIAAALTEAALRTARNNQWRVRAICSYTATYLRRHPEFNDLTVH